VCEEFEAFLRCGVLEHGFLRVVCEQCHAERLLAFSCKKRGFCPSCGARRMAESARHLVEEVFGPRPVRQWVLSVPVPLRFLFASKPEAIGPVLGIVHRVIAGWLAAQTGVDRASAQCGTVTLIQRFGSALNLNIHFHMLWLDGVYEPVAARPDKPRLRRARAPTSAQLTHLAGKIAHRVCRHLARQGWLEGEDESAFLSDRAGCDDGLDALRLSSITYRIARQRFKLGHVLHLLSHAQPVPITAHGQIKHGAIKLPRAQAHLSMRIADDDDVQHNRVIAAALQPQ
jgi:hypothetical protein